MEEIQQPAGLEYNKNIKKAVFSLEEWLKAIEIQLDEEEIPKNLRRFMEDTCLLANEKPEITAKMYYVGWGGFWRCIVLPNYKIMPYFDTMTIGEWKENEELKRRIAEAI